MIRPMDWATTSKIEKFYLHPKNFSIHPIREMGCKNWLCVIWSVKRNSLDVNRISPKISETRPVNQSK